MGTVEKFKPAVTTTILLFLAGAVWEGVGIMLLLMAVSWLSSDAGSGWYLYAGAGVALALLVHHFGFLKIVDKNVSRLLRMNGKRCLFSFIPWRSYLIIAVMVGMGAALRHSTIPKRDLAILYIGIGLALILSSVRYMRIFVRDLRHQHAD